jgi:nucleoside-diphosphate-sugar epimerase
MRILVTGATGFVGANVALGMAARGHEVHCIVRAAHRPWRLREVPGIAGTPLVDLFDPADIDRVFERVRPEWVFHLAAYGAYASQADVARCTRTNLEASVHVIDACARFGVERFVYAGSSSEYGLKEHAPDEAEVTEPNSLYAVTKAAGTAYARHVGRSGRLHTTTLRLYSVYGPFEEPTRLVPTMIINGLKGRYPPLVSRDIARDFVYVTDVVGAFDAAARADTAAGGVYNIGTGIQTPLHAVAEVSRTAFGIAVEPEWGSMTQRNWDTATWVANPTRAARELGWTAQTPFADGFRRTAAWIASSEERLNFYETFRTLPE